jgi:hypothetical protein
VPVVPHVLICYRNRFGNVCHVGLGVNAMHTCRTLRKAGILADPAGVKEPKDVEPFITGTPTLTHVVLEAPWIPTATIAAWMRRWPRIHFTCRCHSQVGFLQVEAGAVHLLREYLHLQDGDLSFMVSGNNRRLCQFIQSTYNSHCTYLPNLYDLTTPYAPKRWQPHTHKLLRISSFGAMRLLKNHSTAAAAAQMIARARGCDLEFHVNVNREEGGRGVLQMLRNLFAGLAWAKLVEVPWANWAEFRHAVAFMDLALQPSFTETFNLTSADAVAEGVPVVASSAVEWLPPWCHADPDDAADIARVGSGLLTNPLGHPDVLQYLARYVAEGVAIWKHALAAWHTWAIPEGPGP